MKFVLVLLMLNVAVLTSAISYDSEEIHDVCMQALERADARISYKADVSGLKNPRKEMKVLSDSIELYLKKSWTVDAFSCAVKLYAISREYGLEIESAQNRSYLKALISLKGAGKYYRSVQAYVGMVDTVDCSLSLEALKLLAGVCINVAKADEAIDAASRALKYCKTDMQKVEILMYKAEAVANNQDFELYHDLMTEIELLVKPGTQLYVDFLDLKALQLNYYKQLDEELESRLECARVAADIYGEGSACWYYYANKAFNALVQREDYDGAAKLLASMLSCIRANSGHADLCSEIFNIGGFMVRSGISGGVELMEAAFEYRNRIVGRDNIMATMAASLAYVYHECGKFAKAAEYQKFAVALKYLAFGDSHSSLIPAYTNALAYLVEAEDYKEAREYASRFMSAYRMVVPRMFSFMTSKERFTFLHSPDFSNSIGNLMPAVSLMGIADTRDAYDAALLHKGILLAADVDFRSRIEQGVDDSLHSDYRKYCAILRQADRLVLESDGPQRKILAVQADSLERILLARSKVLRAGVWPFRIYCWDIQYWLKKKEMAVEFIQARFGDGKNLYGVLCLRYGYDRPQLILLGNDDDFGQISPDEYYVTPKLFNLVWKPMLEQNPGVNKIFFAPSEKFHNIALEHVPDSAGTPMGKKLKMRRLSSTRLICQERHKAAFEAPDSLAANVALFGGLNYYPDEEEIYESMPDTIAIDRGAMRTAIDKNRFVSSVIFLPGTLTEVNDINSMFASQGTPTHAYVGAAGSEDAFKSLSGKGVTHLHIATHGFYEPKHGRGDEDEMLGRTGLLMAGAGVDLSQFEDLALDDGVLTAGEIARMNFDALDLVVLSACETALGDSGSDGVFGLQRGFKKAGAKSIMMSLAKVDDRATQILMHAFYRNLLNGHSKAESLAMAQHTLRQADNGRYDSPRYWAPFIILDAID